MKMFFSHTADKTRMIFCSALLMLTSFSSLPGQSVRVFSVSDLIRVFNDGYKLPQGEDTIKVFGIRGEVISGQFVIISKKDLENVTVEISVPVHVITGDALPDKALEWNFVGSVPLSKNTPNQAVEVA